MEAVCRRWKILKNKFFHINNSQTKFQQFLKIPQIEYNHQLKEMTTVNHRGLQDQKAI